MSADAPQPARQPRLSGEDRRRQIIRGTIACLAKRGPEEWTLRQVARDLGISPSLVTYFFATWNDLLISAYRMLTERYLAEVDRIEGAGLNPRDRLDAIIRLYLADDNGRDEDAGAYIALWAFARREPRLRAEMTRFSAAALGSVAPALADYARDCGGAEELRQVEHTLYILLEGLWYEMAVNPDYMSVAEAQALVWDYLRSALGTAGA